MRRLFCLILFLVLGTCASLQAVELRPLAECSIKVFRDINRKQVWTGKPPVGCGAMVNVEKRATGVFVTTWSSGSSESGWVRVSFSDALGFFEVADRKALEKAARDIRARAARIERCLNSIITVNDPLECRDYALKIYSADRDIGIEQTRSIWLDDDGRHAVAEYAFGNTRRVATEAPADLFSGPALPPGTNLNLHIHTTN